MLINDVRVVGVRSLCGVFRDFFLKKMRVRGESRGKNPVYIWLSRKIYLSLHA